MMIGLFASTRNETTEKEAAFACVLDGHAHGGVSQWQIDLSNRSFRRLARCPNHLDQVQPAAVEIVQRRLASFGYHVSGDFSDRSLETRFVEHCFDGAAIS